MQAIPKHSPYSATWMLLGNGKELLRSAIGIRYITGLARIWQEYPTHNHNPNQTDDQKMDAFLERIFVELGGTSIQVASLYGSQDVFSKFLEKRFSTLKFEGLKIEEILKRHHLSTPQKETLLKAIHNAYSQKAGNFSNRGAIVQQLFRANEVWGNYNKATQAVAHDPILKKPMNEVLTHYHKTLWKSVGGVLVGAVLISAVLSGYVTQYINDYFYNPIAIPFLKKMFHLTRPIQPNYTTVNYPGTFARPTFKGGAS